MSLRPPTRIDIDRRPTEFRPGFGWLVLFIAAIILAALL